jgi:hypothetical protein
MDLSLSLLPAVFTAILVQYTITETLLESLLESLNNRMLKSFGEETRHLKE